MIATFHRIPVIPMPYVDEQARVLAHRLSRRPLMLDVYKLNKWVYRQDHLARVLAAVEASKPEQPVSQPNLNQTFTYSAVAFHGWSKLAWIIVGLLDNVCHVGRVGA